MNILVTGATGVIGSHLCKELIQTGHTVFGLSHSGRIQNIKSILNKKDFHLLRGDIRDVSFISNIVSDNEINTIFHLAAQLPKGDELQNPFSCFDINSRGTLNLLNIAYLNNVNKFIYGSSMSVYSDPPKYLPVDETHPTQPSTIYGVSKLEGELYCNAYSSTMDVVMLRYSGAYGQGQSKRNAIPMFINQALKNLPITIYGNGMQTSDFVYIKDVVQGTLLAFENAKSGIYNIGSGQEMRIRDLAEQIIDYTGSKSEIMFTDADADRPFKFVLDITKSRKCLGYSPHSFDEGLSKYISEFNKYDLLKYV